MKKYTRFPLKNQDACVVHGHNEDEDDPPEGRGAAYLSAALRKTAPCQNDTLV